MLMVREMTVEEIQSRINEVVIANTSMIDRITEMEEEMGLLKQEFKLLRQEVIENEKEAKRLEVALANLESSRFETKE